MVKFQVEEVKEKCVLWIRNFFKNNGEGCNAIVGISGGKDSSVVAALCVEALGKERVVGVLMPCGVQEDIDMAKKLVNHLGIESVEINIEKAINGVLDEMEKIKITQQARINLPPRIRMSVLYAVSQSMNGRVQIHATFLKTGWGMQQDTEMGQEISALFPD
jgi:NAD+ synthase